MIFCYEDKKEFDLYYTEKSVISKLESGILFFINTCG